MEPTPRTVSLTQEQSIKTVLEILRSEQENAWPKGHASSIESAINVLSTIKFEISKRPLIVFDVNNVLICRKYDKEKAIKGGTRIGNFVMWKRPFIQECIQELLKDCDIAVWSSMQLWKVKQACDFALPKEMTERFLFQKDQSHCKRIKVEGQDYPEFVKPLKTIWNEFPQYDATNTIIVDDDVEKMKGNPEQCVFNPGKWSFEMTDDAVFKQDGEFFKKYTALIGAIKD